MNEFLSRFSGGELIAFVAVITGPLIAIVAIITTQWRRVRVAEMEGSLKQQMLDKGMSASDIEKVLIATNEPCESAVKSTGIEAVDRAALAQSMVDNGYEAEDIERVLRAYQQGASAAAEKPVANKV